MNIEDGENDDRDTAKFVAINPLDLEFSPETRRICKQIDFDQKPVDLFINPSIVPSLIIIDGPLNSPLPSCKSPDLSLSSSRINSPRSLNASVTQLPGYLNYKGVPFAQSPPQSFHHHVAPMPCSSLNTWILSDGVPNFSKRASSEIQANCSSESEPDAKRAKRQKEQPVPHNDSLTSESVAPAIVAESESIILPAGSDDVKESETEADDVSRAEELGSRVRAIISEEKVAVDRLQSKIIAAILAKQSDKNDQNENDGGCS